MAQPAESSSRAVTHGVVRQDRPAQPRGPRVTVSVAGDSRAWGAWIADRLERHGLRAPLHHWDPPATMPLEAALGGLTLSGGRILLVFSVGYFQPGVRTAQEWDAALPAVTGAHPGRFAAVSVTEPDNLPQGAAALRPARLTVAAARDAERRLLRVLGLPDTPAPAGDGPRFPLDTPDVWGGVPDRNPRFTGRTALIGRIHRRLAQAVRGAAVGTLLGMSGAGKTQLAAEYAHRFASEYDVVWWIAAGSAERAANGLAALAPELGLAAGADRAERLRAVGDALRRGEPHKRWLLVLDGAEDPDAVASLLPSGSGHVLITSRNRAWADHNTLLMEVPVFARAESVAFVRRRAPRLDRAAADRLAAALEDLPLLLDQAAGWLHDSDMSVDTYVRLLDEGIGQARTVVAEDFPMTFAAAWTVLLEGLGGTAPDTVDLLRLCAFLDPADIPLALLGRVRGEFAGLTGDAERLLAAVGLLARYSVVAPTGPDDGSITGIHLHRIVHLLVREGIPERDRERYARAVRRALADADPGNPERPSRWPAYAALAPHLAPSGALDTEPAESAGPVLNCLRSAYLSGAYGTGLDLARRADRAWRRLLPEDHPRRYDLTHHHTNLLRGTGAYATCEALDRPALAELRARRGADDPDTLRAAGDLAADLRGLGRYAEALELSRYTLDGSRRAFGDRADRTLAAQNNTAVSLRLAGAYDSALRLDLETLLARREVLPPEHAWTLYSELHYATDLRLTGRFDAALELAEQNVHTHRRVLGPDHPQSLRAAHGLALCRRHTGPPGPVRHGLERLLERAERGLGRRDPLTLMIGAAFACLERESGDPDRALAVAERVYEDHRELLGADHPYAVGTRANHALALLAAGDRTAARALLRAAATAMAAAVGADHPWALDLRHDVQAVSTDPPAHPLRDFEPQTV